MGLLDIFGLGSESFKNRREDELANRVQGIIGQRAESVGNGPMQAQGLLGDNLTPEQFSTQLGQQLMGVPGYENNGVNLMNQMTANRQSGFNNMNTVQGAMDRQQTMSPYQQGQLANTRNQNNRANLFKEMNYARQDEELYRNTTEMAGNILGSLADENGVIDYKNSNGVQQNQLVVTLAKSILGNEAVNVDDRGAITLAGGAPGWLGSVVAKMNGGNLGESDFYNVVAQLQDNIQTGMKRNQAMRDRSLGRIQQYGGNETNMPIQINPVQRYRLKAKGTTMRDSFLNNFGLNGGGDSKPKPLNNNRETITPDLFK